MRHWRKRFTPLVLCFKMAAPWIHPRQHVLFYFIQLYYNEFFINDICAQVLRTTNIVYMREYCEPLTDWGSLYVQPIDVKPHLSCPLNNVFFIACLVLSTRAFPLSDINFASFTHMLYEIREITRIHFHIIQYLTWHPLISANTRHWFA